MFCWLPEIWIWIRLKFLFRCCINRWNRASCGRQFSVATGRSTFPTIIWGVPEAGSTESNNTSTRLARMATNVNWLNLRKFITVIHSSLSWVDEGILAYLNGKCLVEIDEAPTFMSNLWIRPKPSVNLVQPTPHLGNGWRLQGTHSTVSSVFGLFTRSR